jgi:hypothetical protein
MLFISLILAAIVLAQPSPPAQGIQLGAPLEGCDIRFPLAVTQCEPVFIFYDVPITSSGSLFFVSISFLTTESIYRQVLTFGPFSVGVGYLEWVCNIPASYGFWVNNSYDYCPNLINSPQAR